MVGENLDTLNDANNHARDFDYDVDPRDPYGSRFEVVSRNGSSKRSHRPRYSSSSNSKLKNNSNKAFNADSFLGDGATAAIPTRRKHSSNRINVSVDDVDDSVPTQAPVSDTYSEASASSTNGAVANLNQTRLRSSGLDSLFVPTSNRDYGGVKPSQKYNEELLNAPTISEPVIPDIESEPELSTEVSSPDEKGRIKVRVENLPQEPSYFHQEKENFFKNRGEIKSAAKPTCLFNRKLTVLKPVDFSCAEKISISMKNKDALVICLKDTDAGNARRILDFAFGAASISGAQVKLGAEKTYIFTIGTGLTQNEKLECLKEGVPLKED